MHGRQAAASTLRSQAMAASRQMARTTGDRSVNHGGECALRGLRNLRGESLCARLWRGI
jgi:hypothetical protein